MASIDGSPTDKPVVITSRAQRGRVGQTYGYPGGGRRLAERGSDPRRGQRPQQARIDVMLALGRRTSVSRRSASYSSEVCEREALTRDRFPAREATPVVFVGGANLIGEAEAVRPSLLLGPPAAIPDERVDDRVGGRVARCTVPTKSEQPERPCSTICSIGRCGSADSIWARRRRTLIFGANPSITNAIR